MPRKYRNPLVPYVPASAPLDRITLEAVIEAAKKNVEINPHMFQREKKMIPRWEKLRERC